MCQRDFSKTLLSAAVITVCLTWTDMVSAQTQSLFGNRGTAGQIGSNLNGSIVGSTTTFGIQSGTSSLGLGGQTTAGNQLGGAATQGAFVGRDDNTGRFVGDQRLTQQTLGSQGSGGGRQFGNRGGGGRGATGRAFGGGNQFGGRSQSSTRRVIRPRQEIAFTYRKPPTAQINSSLNLRFSKIALRQPALRSVTIVLDEQGIATLSGRVNSPETMRLAAIMVRLEPGVRSIKNELTVAESPASR